ncbi:hypothetical protein [Longimicrobium terrae]|uniref:DUF5666 domain-containing protein n=1 Tax=Longimicrobium terrae TaxID=1639882 RepID=A0A841H503_9BACT|nr:hypothetical protein [Longimicrobium terrae]MBB4638727.1 hypothetical protein [Longimicrobium terrae]MBB6072966.1 hypothetical protein [Longimicrobium terrae]NNC33091.1 hypothetical protein [Longimicrobium terrae]
MTNSLLARFPAAVALVLAGTACTPSAPVAVPAGEPYVRGTVESVRMTDRGLNIMVRDNGGGCGLNGTANSATQYLRRSSGGGVTAARAVDVQTGATVAAYVTGPQTRSCPPMARISALIIEDATSAGTTAQR